MIRPLKIISIFILFINALGALWGGAGLMYDPSGEYMQMPLSFLEHAPFSNYLIPGILLFVFIGLFSSLTLFMIFRKHPAYFRFIFLQGIFLTIWISVQVAMLRIFYTPLHLPFFLMGVTLISIGIIIASSEKKKTNT